MLDDVETSEEEQSIEKKDKNDDKIAVFIKQVYFKINFLFFHEIFFSRLQKN